MPKTAALAELIERIDRAKQALQTLRSIFDQKKYVKLSLAVQIMHTFQAIKELAQFCGLKHSTLFATTLENIIDQILKGRIAFSPTLYQQLQHALDCLATGIQKNEKNIESDYITVKKALQHLLLAPKSPSSEQSIPLATADLLALKLGGEEQAQLSPHERIKLAMILNANKTLLSYFIHVRASQLEQTIVTLIDTINTLGSLLTITPTMAQSARFEYAFIFIFISEKAPAEIAQLLQIPGILTALNSTKQPQSWPVHGAADASDQELDHQQLVAEEPIEKKSAKRFLRFTIAEQSFAIPFNAVVEVMPFENNYLLQQNTVFLYMWHDRPIKAFILKDLLKITTTDGVGRNVIILKQEQQYIALIVDTIIGQGESPIQMQPKQKTAPYCSGQAEFGDDKLVQILQVEKLFELVPQ